MRFSELVEHEEQYGGGLHLTTSQQVRRLEEKAELLDSLRRAIGEAIEGGASPQQVLDEVMYRLDIRIRPEPMMGFDRAGIGRLAEKPRIHPSWGMTSGRIGRN